MKENNNLNNIIKSLSNNQDDIIIRHTVYHNLNIIYYYLEEITPIKIFNDFYLEKITNENFSNLSDYIPGIFVKLTDLSVSNITFILNRGNMILSINHYNYIVNIANIPKRIPSKSELDPTNLFDSLDGLIENVYDNLSLIKKRIKSEDLIIKKYIIGSTTKTTTFLLYMKESENKNYIKEIKNKLEKTTINTLLNINDLNSIFNTSNFLPLTFNTGSPDYIASSLLEGRAVIIMDNTPLSLILPTTLSLFTTIKNETNQVKYYTIINRIFNIMFFFLSLFLIPIFIALTNFNPSFFSTLFMANFQLTERGTTFPLFLESIIILFIFEFYRHTTSRSPTNYVQNIVIIFGGLFIGQNAINSGLVGAGILLLTSISYLSSFGITNNPILITSFNIFRLYNIILSYLMGLIGFTIGLITTITYLSSKKSVGIPFLSPFIPFDKIKAKEFFASSHGERKWKKVKKLYM